MKAKTEKEDKREVTCIYCSFLKLDGGRKE